MDATDLSPEAWREAIAHPLFTPLAPWLAQLPAARADRETFNRFAAQTPQYTGGGKPLQFVAPEKEDGVGYEARIFTQGQVPTRENNLHDLFNALTWLACPRSKAALNARHVQRMTNEGKQRGRFGDLLTLLDEGGILIASADPQLETLLRHQQWHAASPAQHRVPWRCTYWLRRGLLECGPHQRQPRRHQKRHVGG